MVFCWLNFKSSLDGFDEGVKGRHEWCMATGQRKVWKVKPLEHSPYKNETALFIECSLHSLIYGSIIPCVSYLHGSELPLKSKT